MREAGYDIQIVPADIDETPRAGESPFELVERLACAKAAAIAALPLAARQVVVAADTIVAIDNKKLGKPHDTDEACAMLRDLSGRTHQVATGVCIISGGTRRSFVEVTDVTFYELSDAEIDGGGDQSLCGDRRAHGQSRRLRHPRRRRPYARSRHQWRLLQRGGPAHRLRQTRARRSLTGFDLFWHLQNMLLVQNNSKCVP